MISENLEFLIISLLCTSLLRFHKSPTKRYRTSEWHNDVASSSQSPLQKKRFAKGKVGLK